MLEAREEKGSLHFSTRTEGLVLFHGAGSGGWTVVYDKCCHVELAPLTQKYGHCSLD